MLSPYHPPHSFDVNPRAQQDERLNVTRETCTPRWAVSHITWRFAKTGDKSYIHVH